MNRPAVLLALLALTACTPTPATSTGSSPAPATASASPGATPASPAASASAAAATGGLLHLTFTNTGTAQPNPGTTYDAESVSGTKSANGLAAGVFAHAGKPDRNFNITLSLGTPKAGDTFPLQKDSPFVPGYLQYAWSDGANVQPKTYLWYATSGTLKIDAVDGTKVSFTYTDAVMVPKNDTGGPTSAGTFTLNGSGAVDALK